MNCSHENKMNWALTSSCNFQPSERQLDYILDSIVSGAREAANAGRWRYGSPKHWDVREEAVFLMEEFLA